MHLAFELNNWGGGGQFAIELDNGVSQGHASLALDIC